MHVNDVVIAAHRDQSCLSSVSCVSYRLLLEFDFQSLTCLFLYCNSPRAYANIVNKAWPNMALDCIPLVDAHIHRFERLLHAMGVVR